MHILHSLMFPAQDCPPRWGRGLEQDLRRVWIPPLHFAVQSDQGVQADQFPFTGGSGYTLKNVIYICVLIHCTVHLVYKILSLSRNVVNQKNNTHHRNNVMNTSDKRPKYSNKSTVDLLIYTYFWGSAFLYQWDMKSGAPNFCCNFIL